MFSQPLVEPSAIDIQDILFHRLPIEILVEIFLYVQYGEDRRHYAEVLTRARYDRRWHRIMLVCRYFRRVAIYSSRLWTDIDFSYSKEWIELCAQRCRGAPFHMYVNPGSRKS
jgi:hypothetical protein